MPYTVSVIVCSHWRQVQLNLVIIQRNNRKTHAMFFSITVDQHVSGLQRYVTTGKHVNRLASPKAVDENLSIIHCHWKVILLHKGSSQTEFPPVCVVRSVWPAGPVGLAVSLLRFAYSMTFALHFCLCSLQTVGPLWKTDQTSCLTFSLHFLLRIPHVTSCSV